jgi:hypothetical protein
MDGLPTVDVEVLKQIAEAANSDLILFFVILALVVVPVLMVLQRGNAAQARQSAEREKNLIEVIQANTEAMSGVKSAIDILAATIPIPNETVDDIVLTYE